MEVMKERRRQEEGHTGTRGEWRKEEEKVCMLHKTREDTD
jgi:hypothetical protein